jgi:hypothetical protein
MFKKSAKTGIVINTDNFGEYLQKRETVKNTMRTEQELKHTKSQLSNVQGELIQIKELLQQLLSEKK